MARIGVTAIRFNQFHRHLVHTLVYLRHGNQMYGRLFLAYLVVNCPISAFAFTWIIHRAVEPDKVVFIAMIVGYQFNGIFGVHLFLSLITKHIHKPSFVMMSLMARSLWKTRTQLRTMLKLDGAILVLHTQNRYGFNYGKFGLVTLAAFSKVMEN